MDGWLFLILGREKCIQHESRTTEACMCVMGHFCTSSPFLRKFHLVSGGLMNVMVIAGLLVGLILIAFLRWRKRPIGSWPKIHQSIKVQDDFLPIVGHLPRILRNIPVRHDIIAEQYRNSSVTDAVLVPFSPPFIRIKNPALLEFVLKTKFESFEKGDQFKEIMHPLLGSGIFNSDGETWRKQRKVASHIFNAKNFRELVSVVFKKEMEIFGDVLSKAADNGSPVDLHDLFFRFTLDSFAKLAFSVDLNTMAGEKQLPFALAFDSSQKALSIRHIWALWKYTEPRQVGEDLKLIRDFARKLVRDYRSGAKVDSNFHHGNILQLFIEHADTHKEEISDEELVDHVLNFVIAGRDTTAQALSWAFYNLSKYPSVCEKLVAEIDSSNVNADLSYETLKESFPYAHAVFMETLRLHPSVPFNVRTAVRDEMLPDGTFVPKGATIAWSSYAFGRLEQIWGGDAIVFRPERWTEDRVNPSEFVFPAFHGGPRICLGKRLATIEATYVIVSVLKIYKIKVSNLSDVTYGQSITLPMRSPLICSVEHRG
ncbi:cytochrome P450 [Cladochytrium replicatum]|nr:cytochrome P450 [Cladochytrium replicatum]